MSADHRICHGLITCVIAFTSLPAFAESAEGRLGDNVRPTSQAIHLTLDPHQGDYRGSVEIQLTVARATDHFRLHSAGHTFERTALSGAAGDLAIEVEPQGEDVIRVRAEQTLAPGDYVLAIDFTAAFASPLEGLYTVEREGSYAFSVFQPVGARRAFPCWDEPEFKIPFQVTLTVPEGNLAIAASREEKSSLADGWRTVLFRKTPPLPSYGVSIAVGPFETVRIDGLGVPGRLVTAQGRSHLAPIAAAGAGKILRALEEYFDRPYPYDKLDLLAVPEFPSGGVENPAAVVFSEDSLLFDATAPADRRRGQAVLMAHELSHMWFGNLVTLKWWDDVWLNESFATWMSYKIVAELFPELRVDALAVRRVQRAFDLDAQSTAPPIRREFASPQEAFTVSAPLTYQKGSKVLTMIESWVGAETFRNGVNAYLETHAWGNAEAADFWRAIDRSANQDVSAAFSSFIEQPGFPLIEVEMRDGRLNMDQQRFANYGKSAEQLRWNIPVAVKLLSASSARTEKFLLAAPAAGSKPTPPNSFVFPEGEQSVDSFFPNAGASGYYRWNLPAEQLRAMAGRASDTLTPVERLDLVSNSTALLAAGKLGGDVYLDILSVVAHDPDPVVVSAVVNALGKVRMALVSSELEAGYVRYLRKALTPAWARLGLAPKPGESEMVGPLRSELYRVLGGDGHDVRLRHHARDLVSSFLAEADEAAAGHPSSNLTLIAPALQVAALDGGQDLFSKYRKRLKASPDPGSRRDLIIALGSFPSDELRHAALDSFIEGELDPGELIQLAVTVQQSADGGDMLLDWLIESHDDLVSLLPPFLRSFLPLFVGGCSAERLATAKAFFGQEKHRVDGTERQMAQVAEQVEDCVRLREREGAVVARYLNR